MPLFRSQPSAESRRGIEMEMLPLYIFRQKYSLAFFRECKTVHCLRVLFQVCRS